MLDASTALARRGINTEAPAPGDVVTFSLPLGFGDADYLGRIVRTTDDWATIRLDSDETVRARVETLTVVDRYRGPRANVCRCVGGWRLVEVVS